MRGNHCRNKRGEQTETFRKAKAEALRWNLMNAGKHCAIKSPRRISFGVSPLASLFRHRSSSISFGHKHRQRKA